MENLGMLYVYISRNNLSPVALEQKHRKSKTQILSRKSRSKNSSLMGSSLYSLMLVTDEDVSNNCDVLGK